MYRLLPGMGGERGDFRALTIGNELTRIIRWMLSGSPEEYPSGITAEWVGDPDARPVEVVAGMSEAPIVSGRVADLFRAEFAASGSVPPLRIDGTESTEWFVLLVEKVVDCLDAGRSSEPEWDGLIRKAVFRADAVPAGLPAFRVPRSTRIYWNEWAAERLTELAGADLEMRLVWSADPARVPHPDPWGF